MRKNRLGFTLLELLAVVVILSILMLIAVPITLRLTNNAKKIALYDYANRIQAEIENAFMNSVNFEFHGFNDEIGYIISLEQLDLDQNGKYVGSVIYNNITDEYSIYIRDSKNMILNYTYGSNKTEKDLVEEYKSTKEVDDLFSGEGVCADHEELYMCLHYANNNPHFDYNRLKGAAVIPGQPCAIIGGIPLTLHQAIRAIAKPGSKEYPWGNNEEKSDNIDTIKDIQVVNVTSQPANSYKISPMYIDGTDYSDTPVYLWFDKTSGILYFGSSTGMVDLYFECTDLFKFCSELKNIDLKKFNFRFVTSTSGMFSFCTKLEHIDTTGWDLTYLANADAMFRNCYKLQEIDFNGWDTAGLASAEYMFMSCKSLKTLDVSKWDVSRIKIFKYMFCGCENLESLDVSNWNTSNAIDMEAMFQNVSSVKYLNVSNWNVSKLKTGYRMFCGCTDLKTLDVSKWDTRNLEYARLMFSSCRDLEELDLSNWDISSLKGINKLVEDSRKIKYLKIGKNSNNNTLYLDPYNPTSNYKIKEIIGGCSSLEYIDLSNFKKLVLDPEMYIPPSVKTIVVRSDYPTSTVNGFTLTKA